MTHEQKWLKNYELAKKYYEKHGNLSIPATYKVVDDDGKIVYLGQWICNQRRGYKKTGTVVLNAIQIKMLEEIGMVWEIRANKEYVSPSWLKKYELAKRYYEEHGDLAIPPSYTTYDEYGNKVNLGAWIQAQRRSYKVKGAHKLTNKQIEMLEEIGMAWKIRTDKEYISPIWLKKYGFAKKYYEEHGNLLIPATCIKIDDEGNRINLGYWINYQRQIYKGKYAHNLNSEQIRLLEEIGMVWSVRDFDKLNKEIAKEYCYYQYGLLDDKQTKELVKEGYFKYSDGEIVKGSALALLRK